VRDSLETISGGFLYDRKLVDHLRSRSDEVKVISLPWRGYPLNLLDNLSRSLRHRLRSEHLDVLLQDELIHPSLFWLNRQIKDEVSFRLLTIVHHLRSSEQRPAWQNRLYRQIERRYLEGVDGYILNSRTTQGAVEGLGVNLSARAHLIACPAGDQLSAQISEAEIARRAAQPGPLRVMFLGNLIPRKGLHTLLSALESLPAGSCVLSIAGSQSVDPRYVRAIRRQIERAGLEECARLLGALSLHELADCLRSQHLLAVPSTYEGYGIAYLEGMGFGLPAIGTTGGAAGEIITTGVDGYLVAPGDASALAECLRRLTADRPLLAALGLAARRRYLAQPTWEQTCREIRNFLVTQTGSV
jgi:glycosyltransferase involved in cell wall biosynthesis